MRKVLSILICLFLVFSSCTTAVYVKNQKKDNNKLGAKYTQELKKLKNELEKWARNYTKRNEIFNKKF